MMDKRKEIEFDLAVGEVVKNLVGGTVRALFDRPEFDFGADKSRHIVLVEGIKNFL